MTIANNGVVKKKVIYGDYNVETVKFKGDDVEYVVENEINPDVVRSHEVRPASFWRRFGLFSKADEEEEEGGVVYTTITPDMVRNRLKPRYIRHFLLGDEYAEPASESVLDKQCRKYRVADIPYKFPTYDCEDRSFACMGVWHLNVDTAAMATYIAWVTYQENGDEKAHALNGFYTNREFYLYEPAQYKAFTVPEFWMINVLIG